MSPRTRWPFPGGGGTHVEEDPLPIALQLPPTPNRGGSPAPILIGFPTTREWREEREPPHLGGTALPQQGHPRGGPPKPIRLPQRRVSPRTCGSSPGGGTHVAEAPTPFPLRLPLKVEEPPHLLAAQHGGGAGGGALGPRHLLGPPPPGLAVPPNLLPPLSLSLSLTRSSLHGGGGGAPPAPLPPRRPPLPGLGATSPAAGPTL